MSIFQTELSDRRVLQISGADRVDFLQNLVTQNIADLPESACVMAALLTPQGKLLHEFLIYAERDALLLSLIHISEPTRLRRISYAVFCLKKKKDDQSYQHCSPTVQCLATYARRQLRKSDASDLTSPISSSRYF